MNFKTITLISLIIFLTSCSVLQPYTPTDDVKRTVVGITVEYLGGIIRNDLQIINEYVAKERFFSKEGANITSLDFSKRLLAMSQKCRELAQTCPLSNLELLDTNITETVAEVTLQQNNNSKAPKIKIILQWSGTGWMIINDSLFPNKGLIKELTGV